MRPRTAFLLVAIWGATAGAQDRGGRDPGAGDHPIVFVRWTRSAESKEIYDAAWRALEPHPRVANRRRLADFGADVRQARKYFETNADAGLVVAFDLQSAEPAPERADVLLVGTMSGAHVDARVERDRLARLVRLFRPSAKRVALFGAAALEKLPGFEVVVAREVEQARGCDLVWVPEGALVDPARLAAIGLPVVSTSERQPAGAAALTVRPDPAGLGLQLAAMILRRLRDGESFLPTSVAQLRVTVDLRAARERGAVVPLSLLARADVVRRGR